MPEQIQTFLEYASEVMSLFAVAVIVIGFLRATGRYTLEFRKTTLERNFGRFKVELGHAMTLALEILVLADVIDSIVATPTVRSLSELAFLVVLRTVLSWTLGLTTEGRWPWQEERAHA